MNFCNHRTYLFCMTLSILSTLTCLKGGTSKLFPFLPNNATINTSNFTPENVGLLSVSGTTQSGELVLLPAISDHERDAIGAALKQMNDMEMMNTTYWAEASRQARTLLAFQPLSDAALDDKIMASLKGESYPEPTPPSDIEIRESEGRAADEYFKNVSESFPGLTNTDLIGIRTSLTISLVTLRLQLDFNDNVAGLPEATLLMIRTKTVAMREKVSQELIKRGVTSI